MNVGFGIFKVAVRDASFTLSCAGDVPRFPNTVMSLRKAVRVHHGLGAVSARRSLRQSLSGNYWKSGIGAGKAAVAQQLLNTYIALSDNDGRTAFDFDIRGDVPIANDVLSVTIDVGLMDPAGQAGRVVLWDTRLCTGRQAQALAAPCAIALEDAIGPGRVTEIAVWHVRSSVTYAFDYGRALRGLPAAREALRRATT